MATRTIYGQDLHRRGVEMIRRLLTLLVVAVSGAAVLGLMPLAAQAQSAVTISLGPTGTIAQSRVVATVPAEISCDLAASQPGPIQSPYFVQPSGSISQAAGRQIASGDIADIQPAIVCDGTPRSYTITFSASTSGPPFHGGAAAVRFSLYINDFAGNSEYGDSGWQTVSLKG